MRSKRCLLGGLTAVGFVVVGACVGEDPVQGAVGSGGTGDAGLSSSSSSSGTSGTSGSSGSSGTSGEVADAATVCTAGLADCDADGVCETAGQCLPQELAAGLSAPISVAVNSTGVFWIDSTQALKCSKVGCTDAPTVLGETRQTQTAIHGRRQLFVNEATAYWLGAVAGDGGSSNQIFVQSCAVAGCENAPTRIGPYQARQGQLVGDADSLFAYDPTRKLRKFPLAGGPAVEMLQTYKPSSFTLAVLGEKLAFSNSTGAKGVWLGTTTDAEPTLMMGDGLHLALNSTTIFASVGSAAQYYVVACSTSGCSGTGTPLMRLDQPQESIEDLVADDQAVYWSVAPNLDASGSIRMCPLPDCAGGPRTIAANQAAPAALALDSEFVYWGNRGSGELSGSIQRVRR